MRVSPELEARILSMAGVATATARPPESHPVARGEKKAPRSMNKTEAAYGAFLEGEKRAGRVAWYRFEGMTLKLDFAAGGMFDIAERYGPDAPEYAVYQALGLDRREEEA